MVTNAVYCRHCRELSSSFDTELLYYIQNLRSTLSIYSDFSAKTCLVYNDIVVLSRETCAHIDINILWNQFEHYLKIVQKIILNTLNMLYMSIHCIGKAILFFISILEVYNVKPVKAVNAH